MTALKAHFDGRVIILDEPAELPRDQPLMIQIEPIENAAKSNGKSTGPSTPTDSQAEDALRWISENAVEISNDVDASVENMYAENHDNPR